MNHEIEVMTHHEAVPVQSEIEATTIGTQMNTEKEFQSIFALFQVIRVFMNFEPFHVSMTKAVAIAMICDKLRSTTGRDKSVPMKAKIFPSCVPKPFSAAVDRDKMFLKKVSTQN